MFKNPCKGCLVFACCITPCDAVTKRFRRWLKLLNFSGSCVIWVMIFLSIYSWGGFFLTTVAGGH